MTDAEKMREAAAQAAEKITGWTGQPYQSNMDYGPNVSVKIAAAIRALPIPDASAQAADCQQAGLVTVDAPQITIRHGRNNDPYPEGWTLCVADNSVTYKRGGHMDIYTIEKGFLAFAAAQILLPTAMQTVPTFTSANASYVPAGLLDEVKAALRVAGDALADSQWSGGSAERRVSDALARLEREVG